MNMDELLFQALSEIRSPALTRMAMDITALGSTTLIMVQAIVAGVFLVLVLHSRRAAVHLGIATGGCALWIELFKQLIHRARPTILPHLADVTGFSFPSGHAANSAAFYITMVLLLSPYVKRPARLALSLIAIILIALIALSRVYLGVHYASDIAGGLVLGIAWSLIAWKLPPHIDTSR